MLLYTNNRFLSPVSSFVSRLSMGGHSHLNKSGSPLGLGLSESLDAAGLLLLPQSKEKEGILYRLSNLLAAKGSVLFHFRQTSVAIFFDQTSPHSVRCYPYP